MPGVKLVSLMLLVCTFVLTGVGDFRVFSQETDDVAALGNADESAFGGDIDFNADDGRPRAVEPAICISITAFWTAIQGREPSLLAGGSDLASAYASALAAMGCSGGLSSPPVVLG